MCMGSTNPSIQQAAAIPTATPQVETTTAGEGQAILDQYAQSLKRKGISSTVRSSDTGSAATGTTNQGLASSGTSQTLG